MNATVDRTIFWQRGIITLNATLVFTWLVMALLVLVAWLITRKLSSSTHIAPRQNLLEVLVLGIGNQIEEVGQQKLEPYIPFVGTLFIFIAVSNILIIIPGYQSPTSSLSTIVALAICVLFAIPLYGIKKRSLAEYFQKYYLQPTPLMLPFNIINRFSYTISLSVRLFGNVMSSNMIVAILLSVVPLLFPSVMQATGLLTGFIQAYIFAIFAMIFITAATTTIRN